MPIIYIDADACPVKDEIYKVAKRHEVRVLVVARSTMRTPAHALIEMIEVAGFGGVDDWIAENVGAADIVITADIPLAARCLAKDARVLDAKGNAFSENDIGSALAMRELMADLRQDGTVTGGPAPMTPKDRSRFLSKLDETIHAAKRAIK